ncbi:SPTLC1 family protein [Megaselia abdita]
MSILLVGEIFSILLNTPTYVLVIEFILTASVLCMIFVRSGPRDNSGRKRKLTKEEEEEAIKNYTPEDLIEELGYELSSKTVTGRVGKHITIDGKKCLNVATHNYLGLLEDQTILEKAMVSLKKYGVGSCGPRGFYGTLDVHLDLEDKLAKFMGAEEAVVYSYGFSTMASAIPAYSKRNDVIFADEKVNFAIQKGLQASRSTVYFYKHNNMADLERLLLEKIPLHKKNPKHRRFLVAEGIYMNTGEMCPLPELVAIRKKYQLRLFLDEGISFGTIGKTGRGLTELLNVDPLEIDLICGSLEWAVPSVGGFCVGSHFIIEHQRLSGLGYCFSASLPPLLTQAAITALDTFEEHPEMFSELVEVSKKVHKELASLPKFKLSGDKLSPVKHLFLEDQQKTVEEKILILEQIVEKCLSNSLAIVDAKYLLDKEQANPEPSLRITVNRKLTDDDVKNCVNVLKNVSNSIC